MCKWTSKSKAPPPVAPPPPTAAIVKPVLLSTPQKFETSTHVAFDLPNKFLNYQPSKAPSLPPQLPAAPDLPTNTSGETTYYQTPQFKVLPDPCGGPGYIKINGGVYSNSFHTYEACINSSDLMNMSPVQQANLIHAVVASQMPGSSHKYSHVYQTQPANSGHVSEINEDKSNPAPVKAIAAIKQSAPSDAMTSVSRRPPNPLAASPGGPAHEPSNSAVGPALAKIKCPKLRCCSCGEGKREDFDNVKVVKDGVSLCWRCVVKAGGSEAVREWLGGVS